MAGARGSKAIQDEGWRGAMATAYASFPDDEPKLFYGLHSGGHQRAAKLFREVYAHGPDHPGVLHYLIHVYDDPVHAEHLGHWNRSDVTSLTDQIDNRPALPHC